MVDHVKWWRSGVAVLALGLSLAAAMPSTATAQTDAERAERLITEGVELRRAGEDERAMQKFLAALELAESPRGLAQVALAAQALGNWLEADRYLRRALAATDDPWIQRNRAALDGSMATIAERVGSIEVRASIDGAQVLFNGELLGTTPLAEPLRVLAGAGTLELQADGFYTVSRTVEIEAGQLTREMVELRERRDVDEGGDGGEGDGGGGEGSGNGETDIGTASNPTLALAGWISIGVGGAAAILGVIAYFLRELNAADWNDDEMCLVPSTMPGTAPPTREETCGDSRAAAETWEVVAATGFVAAGVVVVAGVVLLIASTDAGGEDDAAAETGGVSFSCGGGPGDVGIACGGVF